MIGVIDQGVSFIANRTDRLDPFTIINDSAIGECTVDIFVKRVTIAFE